MIAWQAVLAKHKLKVTLLFVKQMDFEQLCLCRPAINLFGEILSILD